MSRLAIDTFVSPIGPILIVTDGPTLVAVDFEDYRPRMLTLLTRRYDTFDLVPTANPAGITTRMQNYFSGDWAAFEGTEVATGGTAFQQIVWQALRQVPRGTTLTYGELARQIDRPRAVRAVGTANSLNPIAIVLPCHRIIGANGSLTGYAGGLNRKHWLLNHEGAAFQKHPSQPSGHPSSDHGHQMSLSL